MDKKFLKNSFSLYILAFTKLVIPFLTLPYLTRVLSVETYGIIAYVKSLMGYVQLIIDFGFMLFATREIADARKEDDWTIISSVVSTATVTRIFLGLIAFFFISVLTFSTPMLRDHLLYVVLMFLSVFLTIFWMDFLFSGIEKMEVLSYRFLSSKILTTLLILIIIKSDKDIVLMGFIEIAGTLVASFFTFFELFKLKIKIIVPSFSSCYRMLYHSFLYFFSNFATSAFGLLITFLIGLNLQASDVAYWSLALQLVGGIQSFYSPILDALYPAMIRNFRIKLVLKVLCIVMPVIFLGCIIIKIFCIDILKIIAGDKYVYSAQVLIYLIPVLIISFPAMLFGWPYLGALGQVRLVTMSSIFASVGQVVMLFTLILTNNFNLYFICITRCIAEFLLFFFRFIFSIYVTKKEYGSV